MKSFPMSVWQNLGVMALAVACTAPLAAPLAAQQPASVQLAFGYQCDNTFALRNEGSQSVTAEYVVAGTRERGTVTVKANETVELESLSNSDLQLFVNGKLVATEHKGNRSCVSVAPSAAVVVRHLDSPDVVYVQPRVVEPVYVAAPVVYVRPWDYGYYAGPRFSLSLGFPFYGGGYRGRYPFGYGGAYGGFRGFGWPMMGRVWERGESHEGGHRR